MEKEIFLDLEDALDDCDPETIRALLFDEIMRAVENESFTLDLTSSAVESFKQHTRLTENVKNEVKYADIAGAFVDHETSKEYVAIVSIYAIDSVNSNEDYEVWNEVPFYIISNLTKLGESGDKIALRLIGKLRGIKGNY